MTNREIIENQIILCLELQKKCGIENIETFLALSKRVVELDEMLSSTEEHPPHTKTQSKAEVF